jgi:hypothetical protein
VVSGLAPCPRRTCEHLDLVHDWSEAGQDPVCCAEGCSCGKGPTNETGNPSEVTESAEAVRNECKQVPTDIRGEPVNEPGVTMDSGFPINPVANPSDQPAEPATQPVEPPHYAGHTPDPGYGPNPTAQGVRGYRDLPPEDVDLINQVKALQEAVADVWAVVYLRPGSDERWLNVSRLHLEEGISALVRSVAQPHDPFGAALQRLAAQAHSRAQQAVADDLARSTMERILAQQSQDHRPDEGSRA